MQPVSPRRMVQLPLSKEAPASLPWPVFINDSLHLRPLSNESRLAILYAWRVVEQSASTLGIGPGRRYLNRLQFWIAKRAEASSIHTAGVNIQRTVDPVKIGYHVVAVNDYGYTTAIQCP